MISSTPEQAHVIERLAGVAAGSPIADALAKRAEIMELSQASHDAMLTPRAPGGLSHGLRAVLAARMAAWNGDEALAAHYHVLLDRSGERDVFADAASPTVGFEEFADRQLRAILRHADILSKAPREATRRDIEALKAAGVGEADIVRLAELTAFVNYQIRVMAGLRLLAAS
ncbi:CMD domain protein [Chelatococcus sp. GCM10030263]|uniref:CMD domain protein n=1 Tax=Chelatococcus sp. GCM10030263 TaxID=3273387 RepID=UPI0036233DEF